MSSSSMPVVKPRIMIAPIAIFVPLSMKTRAASGPIPGELVEDLPFERADSVLVDRARQDDAILDHDEGVFFLEFLQPDVPFRGNRGLERHAQVLRQDRGEEGLPRPELLAAFLDVRWREMPDVDLGQDERDLLAGELAILVREQERPRDVVVDAADHGPAEP